MGNLNQRPRTGVQFPEVDSYEQKCRARVPSAPTVLTGAKGGSPST
jgi:hypothetical protein